MIWGPVLWVAVLNVGALDVWSKPFIAQGKAGSWNFPPNCVALCWQWGLLQECVTSFDISLFSVTQCVGVTQPISGSLSERIAPCVAVYLVHPWEEGYSGASYVAIFVQSPC